MEKFMEFASRLQKNRYLDVITSSLMMLTPLFIVGAVFTLINSIPLEGYQAFLTNYGIKEFLTIPTNVTTNISALYIAYVIGYRLASSFKRDDCINFGIISLISFIIITPFTTGENYSILALDTQWFGPTGMMSAFINSTLMTRLCIKLYDMNLTIKMPEGVPTNVASSFSALIPTFIITLISLIIRAGLSFTPFGNIHALIYGVIALPLTKLGGSFPAFLIYVILIHVFWFLGLHGSLVVGTIVAPILIPLGMENIAATNAGITPPNILTLTFLFQAIGATAGHTLGLCIALLRAKSKQYRMLGKLSIIPNIFCINEPLIFGLPIVMNFRLLVPFVGVPLISFIGAYALTLAGILPINNGISVPAGVPVGIGGFMIGGWRWGVYQIATVGLSYVVYRYFFKQLDQEVYLQEVNQ